MVGGKLWRLSCDCDTLDEAFLRLKGHGVHTEGTLGRNLEGSSIKYGNGNRMHIGVYITAFSPGACWRSALFK
jgi:hypothetical protein